MSNQNNGSVAIARRAGVTLAAAFTLWSAAATAGTITVTTTANNDVSDGHCSLVEALKAVNGTGHYRDCNVAGGQPYTVSITASGTINSSSALAPNKDLTLVGTGLTTTTINFTANNSTGCGVVTTHNLTVKNLTLQQNTGLFLAGLCGDPNVTLPPLFGVDLEGVRVRSFQNRGIAMWSGGVGGNNVTVQNNHTPGNGGGIAIFEHAAMGTFTNLSLVSNVADDFGGGLFNIGNGNANIINGTISGNHGTDAGGIYTDNNTLGYLILSSCTVASNSALNSGGGIYVVDGTGTPPNLFNSVVVSNTASFGANFYDTSPGTGNSALSYNGIWGGPFDQYTNDIGMDGGPNRTLEQATVSSEFFPLSNTGVPYFLPVYPLRSTSSAVNFATCAGGTDERGVSRPQGPGCDCGAWEQ